MCRVENWSKGVYYTFYSIYCHMCKSVAYDSILRSMLGDIDD